MYFRGSIIGKLLKDTIFLVIMLVLTMGLGLPATAEESLTPSLIIPNPTAQMTDIQGNWAELQISDWVNKGLAQGYQDGTFKPDNSISRAEFMTLANRVFGYSAIIPANFSDVSDTDWFAEEVGKAKAAGYISGYPDGTVKPNEQVSRQEVAAMLAKITKLEIPADTSNLNNFADVDDIPEWSKGYISSVVNQGFMHGYPDQTYQAEKAISRAEAIVTLNNAMIATAPKITYDKAGIYGPATGVETLNGNVSINIAGVTLQNSKITGNLNLAAGIGEGEVTLKNVTVQGNTIIKGGGAHSVVLENCTLANITVDKAGVRVVASGNTSVTVVQLNSGATLVELSISGTGFETITLSQTIPANTPVTLEGNFNNVNVQTADVQLNIISGTVSNLQVAETAQGASLNIADNAKVGTLTLNSAATVTGKGSIETANVNASGSTIEQKPETLVNPSGVTVNIGTTPDTTGGTSSTQTVTISGIELTNTFGAFKISTNVVTTAENILSKVKVNGVALQSVEKRNQGADGTAWKAFVANPQKDTDYTITCELPFTISGTSIVRWSSTVSASAVTGVEAEDVGDNGNGSDLQVCFLQADGENQKIDSYRVMIVRSASASSFNLTSANAVTAAYYTVLDKTGADSYMLSMDGAKDTTGHSITNGIAYKVFVLSVADGSNATVNGLSTASNQITLTATPSGGGGGGDVIPPTFADTYPKLNNIGSQNVDLLVKANEGGKAYYVVLDDNDPLPTAAQVKAGLAANNVSVIHMGNANLSANTEAIISITGLNQNTAYDIYLVAEDTIQNLQNSALKIDLQTINPPDQSTANVSTPSNMTRRELINLTITGAKDLDGVALDGSVTVTVVSDKAGVAFNNPVNFTAGGATVSVPTGDAAPDFVIPTALGLHTLTVTIAGVTQSQTVSVTIADSAVDGSKSTAVITPALGPGTTSTITVTLRDTNNNLIANTTKNMKIVTIITDNNPANVETYTINEPYKTVGSTTNLNTTPTITSDNTPIDANGQYSFTVTLPNTIDVDDGVSVQVTQNQITKKIGGLFEYKEN